MREVATNIDFAGKSEGWKAGEDNKFLGKVRRPVASVVGALQTLPMLLRLAVRDG
jgi:hypothetical protein